MLCVNYSSKKSLILSLKTISSLEAFSDTWNNSGTQNTGGEGVKGEDLEHLFTSLHETLP